MTATQVSIRLADEQVAFVDAVRDGMSRAWYVKRLVEWAHESWITDGSPTVVDGRALVEAQAEYTDFGDIEPVSLDGPDYDEAESLPSFVVPQPWQVHAARVSAQYRRELEQLAVEAEPANPYLLP